MYLSFTIYLCRLLYSLCYFFFFKQKTAYEMRISDWSSDVCSSDLAEVVARGQADVPRQRHGDEDARRDHPAFLVNAPFAAAAGRHAKLPAALPATGCGNTLLQGTVILQRIFGKEEAVIAR